MAEICKGLNYSEMTTLKRCQQKAVEYRKAWLQALLFSPRLARYCPCWNDFTLQEWVQLLSKRKNFIHIAPIHCLSVNDWRNIAVSAPELLKYCPVIDELPEDFRQDIQALYPEFSKPACIEPDDNDEQYYEDYPSSFALFSDSPETV